MSIIRKMSSNTASSSKIISKQESKQKKSQQKIDDDGDQPFSIYEQAIDQTIDQACDKDKRSSTMQPEPIVQQEQYQRQENHNMKDFYSENLNQQFKNFGMSSQKKRKMEEDNSVQESYQYDGNNLEYLCEVGDVKKQESQFQVIVEEKYKSFGMSNVRNEFEMVAEFNDNKQFTEFNS